MRFLLTPSALLPVDSDALSIVDSIPVGMYYVKASRKGFVLANTEHFKRPKRMYGNVSSRANRILDTFTQRTKSTGVQLSGQPGTGKTLLAREVCITAIERGIPVLIVEDSFGEGIGDFVDFCRNLDTPVVILFDEFEKVFDESSQNALLSLFDGTDYYKKLYLMTANDSGAITFAMQSRPGRMFYHFRYLGLEPTFIAEYLDAELTAIEHRQELDNLLAVEYASITFDCLQALVEETNRYNESPKKTLEILNIDPNDKVEVVATVMSKTGKFTYVTHRNDISAGRFYDIEHFEVLITAIEGDQTHDKRWISVNVADSLKAKTGAEYIFECNNLLVACDQLTNHEDLVDSTIITLKLQTTTGIKRIRDIV